MPKKILLADDSVTIQKVVELTFAEGDYEVTSVGNGRAALEKLKESRPDILLCDIIMPEVSGYEVAEFVKRNPEYSAIPVILLTGTFEPFDEEKARLSGADTYITKPFDSRMLVEKVESLLKRRLVLQDAGPTAMEVLTGQGGSMTVGGEAPALEPPPPPAAAFEAAVPAAPAPAEPAAFEAFGEAEPFAAAAQSPFAASESPFESAAPQEGAPTIAFAAATPAPPPEPAAPVAPPVPPAAAEAAFAAAEPEVEDLSSLVPPGATAMALDAFAEPPSPAPAAPAREAEPEVTIPAGGPAFGEEEPLSAETGDLDARAEERSGAEDWGQAAAPEPPAPKLPAFVESAEPEPEVESTPWSDFGSEPVAPAEGVIHEMTDQQEMVAAAHQAEIVDLSTPPKPPELPAAAVAAPPEPAFESEPEPAFQPEPEPTFEAEAAGESAAALPEEPAADPVVPAAAPPLTEAQIEAVVRKVIAEMAPELIRQVAWEVIPELAESVIKRRIQELESQVE